MRRRALIALCAVLGGAAALALLLTRESEFARFDSPDGAFTAVVTSPLLWSLIPGMPGSGSDRPGAVRIERRDGRSCGRAPLELVQLAYGLRWEAGEASLPAIAHWDLAACRVALSPR